MTPLLRVRNLHFRRGDRRILAGVNLSASTGDIVALMGLSGSGKTTILRIVAGLESFDEGEIEVGAVRLAPLARARPPGRALHDTVGMVFQSHHLFEHLTALVNVSLAPVRVRGAARATADASAQALLDTLGVGHRSHAYPRELSGGEAQRVALARTLAMNPALLLLDEPTASLDPVRRADLAATIRSLAAEGRTLLMTSHDDEFVRQCATHLVILADGQVVEEGATHLVLNAPAHHCTRQLLQVERARRRLTPSDSGSLPVA